MQQFPPTMASGNGPNVIIYVPTNVNGGRNLAAKYPDKQSIGFGITQIIIGSLCILFNIIDLVFIQGSSTGTDGHGIWCGVLFIVTGSLGVGAGKQKTKCMIIAYMVMCIIAATFTTTLLSLGIIGALISGNGPMYYYHSDTYLVNVAMQSCLAIMAVIAAVLFIWGSVICCKSGICCDSSSNVSAFVPANYNPATGQVMYLAQPPTASELANAPQLNNPPPYANYQQVSGLNASRLDFHSSTEVLVKKDLQQMS